MSKPVVVIGAGGHGRVVADALVAAGRIVIGFTDQDPAKKGTVIDGVPVLGDDTVLEGRQESLELANGIGSVSVSELRREIFERMRSQGFRFSAVIHPQATVSRHATVAEGAQIMAGVVVQAGTMIEVNALINTGALIDHDCVVGAHSHIAPGACLSGAVTLGECCHIGTGASIIQGVSLGARTLTAAGAVVIASHAGGATLIGTPAKAVIK